MSIIGKGSYGEVSIRDGKAIKKFSKLSHLIQEYMALTYLQDCNYVVKCNGVNFGRLELHMELYDCSLKKWLEEKNEKGGPSSEEIKKVIHDILMGLIELHDRNLAHGDIKPGNILVRKNPLKVVLGDCGFVSISKYAKVERTAVLYRDPVVTHESTHDMFSLGVILLEIIGQIRIEKQASYDQLKKIVNSKISNIEYKRIIYHLVHSDKDKRPSARYVLHMLYEKNPPKWVNNLSNLERESSDKNLQPLSIRYDEKNEIRSLMKRTVLKYELNRSKKGYGALLWFFDTHTVKATYYELYVGVTLMILSSIFGKSGFKEDDINNVCTRNYNKEYIYQVLQELLSDKSYIDILLSP